ncbi:50S ribosomal protein L29 [Sulfuracidifex metallicus]|jgi:large subunit ribosomal protein L29|uniref:Large ribosomal subunit protein uL29 n=1 Tax=Sulfuracidifex metallicus DSM 6482 = JCM 9184 TaxID=523847 RepID=A0A6A9QRX4_SULME|nr:50S ribosomal protein L29 [Sulfuracidifex metallicus]MUN28553.1 50S ribosomal protein L29 [Sulfuracidifex metallicus DSM 6482 = JCM 9184]WOE50910.1 50S ribosomal protein L29 [Sulfuracidifex metallicus DSM 6482 = JCM 9184]
MTIKPKEIREMKMEDIDNKIAELQMELMKLRLQSKIGTLKNTSSIRNTRKDIARLITIKAEMEKASKSQSNESKL